MNNNYSSASHQILFLILPISTLLLKLLLLMIYQKIIKLKILVTQLLTIKIKFKVCFFKIIRNKNKCRTRTIMNVPVMKKYSNSD